MSQSGDKALFSYISELLGEQSDKQNESLAGSSLEGSEKHGQSESSENVEILENKNLNQDSVNALPEKGLPEDRFPSDISSETQSASLDLNAAAQALVQTSDTPQQEGVKVSAARVEIEGGEDLEALKKELKTKLNQAKQETPTQTQDERNSALKKEPVENKREQLNSFVVDTASSQTTAFPKTPETQAEIKKQVLPDYVLQQQSELEAQKKAQLQALLNRGLQPKLSPQAQPEPTPAPVTTKPKPIVETPIETRVEAKIQTNVIAKSTITIEDDISEDQICKTKDLDRFAWLENGRPVWGQDDFDALLFTVSGLKLAVPLVCLGQIYPINEKLGQIFGQAEWFMGVQPTATGKVRVINTALFVMPEKYKSQFLDSASYVISIDGLDWGLAVDSVEQPIRLQPQDVTWRSERSKRPWLAGTVKSAMCALIDIPKMGGILQQSDKNRT